MQPIGTHKQTGGRQTMATDGLRVLPRFLRKPVRLARRLLIGDVRIPRFAETLGMVAVIGGAALYGSVQGGQFQTGFETLTARAGLAVREIEINGNVHVRPQEVFAAIGLTGQRSLLAITPSGAREALSGHDWIKDADIRKEYPGKLVVTITEKRPFALWQTGRTIFAIEADGTVIGEVGTRPIGALPLLVGDGAPDAAPAFLDRIARAPWLAAQVHAHVRVGERRWDLRLQNGMTVMLPQNGLDDALARLEAMDADYAVTQRDLASIDLRLEDRTVMALRADAMDARNADLKDRGIEPRTVEGAI